ncbi:uncharacterized protein LOC110915432 [Helianthus annuus]|nr:uncharacterized protein LOC110915432 [Helianthus annuus]
MSNRGKRGAATFSKKDCDFTVELNQLMQPIGKNANDFTSWLGVKLKAEFSYHIPSPKFGKQRWDELWEDIKREWSIESNAPKTMMLKNAKKRHTNWRSYLTTEYVRKGLTPFGKYKNLDSNHWKEFVTQRTSKEFEAKSKRATKSAKANKNFTTLGRTGFAALTPRLEKIWSQLVPVYSCLKSIQDLRSKRYIVSRAKRNRKTNIYSLSEGTRAQSIKLAHFEKKMIDDGSYFSGKEDPLTKLLGRERGGRSRTVSSIIGHTKVRGGLFQGGRQDSQNNVPTSQNNVPTGCASDASGGSNIEYPSIKEPTFCELLYTHPSKREKIVGTTYLHPNSTRIIHNGPMSDGYVKIEVIEIYPEYKKTSLPELSCYEELEDYGDAIGHFIQWPLSSIKLSNIVATHHIPTMIQPAHENTCYSPEFEDVTEQYQIHENHQIDMTMVENVSDEFLFGPHDISTEHDVDGSEELDMMFSEPVEQTQASTMSKEQKRIQEALWNIEHLRPKSIKSLAERLRKHYGGETSIQLKCPTGMYPTTDSSHSYDYVEYEGVLQFLANGLLDASFIHWCQMFLYNHMRSKKENAKGKNRVAYFNTQYITGKECEKNLASVKEHLVEVYKLHKDKKYFLAPFFYGGHWVLFIVSPSDRKGWILDSVD